MKIPYAFLNLFPNATRHTGARISNRQKTSPVHAFIIIFSVGGKKVVSFVNRAYVTEL